MWFLRGPKGELIYLKPNSEINVGRTQGDIILRDDKSVSRNHASVSIQSTTDGRKSKCFVKDLGSKYGSSIIREDEQIKVSKEGTLVNQNDKIKFGLQDNDYIASYIPVVVLVSSMNDIEYLQSIVNDLDGCIVREWTKKVTHLTTPKAVIGEKIAMALVNCIPIVGMEYWEVALNAVRNNQEWPKWVEYILPITEDVIDNAKVSLAPNLDRKTLFNNLTFLFFSFSQFKIYKEIIKAAGGKVLMFDTSVHTDLTQFCSDEFIAVYYMIGSNQTEESILDSQGLRAGYEQIEELLRKKKRRMISDSEITLAILHCSLKQNCNPKHNYKELLLKQKRNVSNDNKKAPIIALDTQDLRSKSASLHSGENIIAETNDFTSQEHGNSQEDTQYSSVSSHIKNRASPGPSVTSSICPDSQESTGDIETDLANLNMDRKRSEKRGPEPLSVAPVKKPKLNIGSSLFPVLPKSKSQDRFSQSLQGSQRLQGSQTSQDLASSQSSQMSSRSNVSALFSQHVRETTSQSRSKFSQPSTSNDFGKEAKTRPQKNIFDSWMDESRDKEKELNKEMSRQSEKRKESNMQTEEIESPAEKSKENEHLMSNTGSEVRKKRMEARNQLNLEAKTKSISDESIIWGEPEAKKKRMESRDDSSSEVLKILKERNDKRKRDSGGSDSESNNIVIQKKRIDSFNTTQTELSVQRDDFENQDCIFVRGLIREQFHDSLLERTFGHKTFHKIYNTIPRTRVTLDSIIVCGTEDENLE